MIQPTSRARRSGLVAWAALITSIIALVASVSGSAGAARHAAHQSASRPRAGQVVRLGRGGKIPASLLPIVAHARNADRLGGQTASDLQPSCAPTTVDLGTWCLMTSPYPLTNDQLGKNNYFYATQACVQLGGWLPTAAQLIGAANRVKLDSVIHDSQLTATIQLDPTRGLKDQREMSATLVTTAAGSDAAGSEGVSQGSTGDPHQKEPNPTPFPANPEPETLQYVTIYDNFDKGGFAGSEPVSKPENFRCGFDKIPGASSQGNS
jgi:hypothetical protein